MADELDETKLVVDWILACRNEADLARTDRMRKNAANYDMFHLNHDFRHKQEGQSQEVLSKQPMAVEQIKSFFQQALADIGDWWSAESCYPDAEESMPIRPHEVTKLTNYMLEKANFFSHVGNSIESALLGSLAISKIDGCLIDKPKFISSGRGKRKKLEKVDAKTWRLKFHDIRQENYYPDPTGQGLYESEDLWVDLHVVKKLSEGDDAVYDSAEVAKISLAGATDSKQETRKAAETGQNLTQSGHRPQVKLTVFLGTILDKKGEVLHENAMATLANDTILIQKPTPNPFWHQSSNYVKTPLMEVANSVWHKAPMDAPTCHNQALTELYNLFVDGAMMQVHAIKQIRKDMLDNPAQVANGIKPGATLAVSSALPPGVKVLEPVTAVEIPQAALNIYNIMAQEFNASALTNDLRQGVMPFRAVKATEVVEASQTITSVFQGMAKNYESKHVVRELELAWQTTCQHWNEIAKEEFQSLFGADRGEELWNLAPEDVFAATVNGLKFRVFGISLTLSKAQDFRKLTTLLQTIGASEVLIEEFAKKYDFGKLLGEIMTSLNIDKHKLEIPHVVQKTMAPPEQPAAPPQQATPGQAPNQMSQVPGAGAGSLQDMFSGGMPQTQFPASRAMAGR